MPTTPAARPLTTQSAYMVRMEWHTESAAVEAASAAVAPMSRGLGLRAFMRAGEAMPPRAKQMLQMVSMRLTWPLDTPISAATGLKKRPATLVTRPTPDAMRPHMATSTNRYVPLIFMRSTPSPRARHPVVRQSPHIKLTTDAAGIKHDLVQS